MVVPQYAPAPRYINSLLCYGVKVKIPTTGTGKTAPAPLFLRPFSTTSAPGYTGKVWASRHTR